MKAFDDNQLMKMVRDGDLGKMGLLYERHHRALFAYFHRLTNDRAGSEDLVHSVFYRLLKYRHTFRDDSKFVHWMYAIARNIRTDRIKKKAKDPINRADDIHEAGQKGNPEMNAEQRLITAERVTLLKEALQRLSPEKREAIILSKFQGMKYQDIAQISDCTESAVKSRIQRGLLELKTIIQQIEAR